MQQQQQKPHQMTQLTTAKVLNQQLTKDIEMANKHLKRHSTPYMIRGLQIKTSVRHHYTEWPKPKTLPIPNASQDVEQ